MAFELILQCHGATRMMREGGYACDSEPMDAGAIARLEGFARTDDWPCVVSPAKAARQTAEGRGGIATVDPALRDMDHGSWAGCTFLEVQASDPDGLAAWMADPAAGAPGGETLASVRVRMSNWLAAHVALSQSIWAVTHPMVIRAALAAAIDMPLPAALRIDIAPLGIVRLGWNRQWRLRGIEGVSR